MSIFYNNALFYIFSDFESIYCAFIVKNLEDIERTENTTIKETNDKFIT